MPTVFKKFSKSDISITPFTAHKQSTFNSSSLSGKGGRYYSSSFPTIAYRNGSGFEWANSSSADDPNNHKKFFQLDHLFYKNSKLEYHNKFSKIKYFDHYRVLHDKVNILSLPYKTIGYKINPQSFTLTTGSITIKDDGKGNLYDTTYGTITSVTNTTDFKNEKFRVFYLGPERGYERYDLSILDGKSLVNYSKSYTKKGLLDNSFLFNELEYNNVTFSSKNIGGGNYSVINLKGSPYERNLRPVVFEHRPRGAITDVNEFGDLYGVNVAYGFATENAIDFSIGPFGDKELVWQSFPTGSDVGSKNDGGLGASTRIPIDSGSAYMFTCFLKRIDWGEKAYTVGSTYWGPQSPSLPENSVSTRDLCRAASASGNFVYPQSSKNDNPYFQHGDPSIEGFGTPGGLEARSASLDRWLLTVGYIYPSMSADNYSSIPSHSITYDVASCLENGFENALTASWNGSDNITYVWSSASLFADYRAIGYNFPTGSVLHGHTGIPSGGFTKTHEFTKPTIFKVDGTEPRIKDLLTPDTLLNLSNVVSPNHSRYNFNGDDNFALSFLISSSYIYEKNLAEASSSGEERDPFKRYILSKSTTKRVPLSPNLSNSTKTSGSSQIINVDSEPQYPFEIYYQSSSLHFDRFDGNTLSSVSAMVTHSNSNMLHIVCQKTGSNLELYVDGNKLATSTDNTNITQNKADLFIGSKGIKASSYEVSDFQGAIAQIMLFDDGLSQTQINNLSQSIDNKPYIGNLFYNNGLAAITKPNYQKVLNPGEGNQNFTLQYQGTHLIYENEYQCMAESHEFDITLNPSARKNKSKDSEDLANFTTGSNFKPYVTTVGLYNDNGELLVIGKLGQAIRMSDEADTTYVVRFDT